MADAAENVGGIIKSLPISMMIVEPCRAFIDAYQASLKAYVDAIMTIGFIEVVDDKGVKRSQTRMARGIVRQSIRDAAGNATGKVQELVVDAPVLCLATPKPFGPARAKVEFEMTVETSDMQSSSTEGKAEFEAKVGWGPFSASFKGSLSHKSEQVRKTDTRARYAFSIEFERDEVPEGVMRFNEFLLNASMQSPVPIDKAPELPIETKKAA